MQNNEPEIVTTGLLAYIREHADELTVPTDDPFDWEAYLENVFEDSHSTPEDV